jgi:hypothetical protein
MSDPFVLHHHIRSSFFAIHPTLSASHHIRSFLIKSNPFIHHHIRPFHLPPPPPILSPSPSRPALSPFLFLPFTPFLFPSEFYKPNTTAYMERMLARQGWLDAEKLEAASAREFNEKHAKL